MRSFGELLVIFTQRAGISDSELARATGVGRQTIFRWKEGQVARPRYREDVLRIADKLRLSGAERDELLLAAGFAPQNGQLPPAADGVHSPAALPTPELVVEAALEQAALEPVERADVVPPMAEPAAAQAGEPAPATEPASATSPAPVRPPRLVPRPGLLLGTATLLMLLVAVAGYWLLPLLLGRRADLTPTPVAVTLTAPTPAPAATLPPPTPIVAAAGEKLLLVAPFVGYTSEELRFNVAGRIQEALEREMGESALADVRVAVIQTPVTAQTQARGLLAQSGASAIIWGEYDAGRVRANVTVPAGETQWINPVDSPARLAVVINDAVPNAARMLALYALGRLYQQEQDWSPALRTFEKALALQPSDTGTQASLHFYIGTLLPKVQGLKAGVLTQAIEHFSAGLVYQPDWENLLYNRGTMYLGRGLLSLEDDADLAAAIADLTAVIERQPRRVDPLINRGIAYYERNNAGDATAALADFSHVIELAPNDYRGYYHRGLAKIRTGATDWPADLLAAAERHGADPAILNGLCWGYALDGKADVALPYCEQAVAGDPTGSSFDGRAMAYSQLGRYDEAAADLAAYLDWVGAERPDLYTKLHGPEAEAWIAALRQGQDPFTAPVRAALR